MVTLGKQQENLARPLRPDFHHKLPIYDLSYRNLEELDATLVLTAYGGIENVNFSNNWLTTLTDSFCMHMIHVQVMDLSNNRITHLPESLGDMKNLHTLVLYSNKIRFLPLSLWKLEKLNWLELGGNPLDAKLREICGPDLSQGRHVAVTLREFYFLLHHSLATCPELFTSARTYAEVAEGKANVTMADVEDGVPKTHDATLKQVEGTHAVAKSSESFALVLKSLRTISEEKLKRRKWSEHRKLKEGHVTQSQTSSTSVSLPSIRRLFPLLTLVGFPIVLFFLLSVLRGPPDALLQYGKFRYHPVIPAALMETLAWFHVCTLYPLRKYFPYIDSLTNIFITPSATSSWWDFFTRWF